MSAEQSLLMHVNHAQRLFIEGHPSTVVFAGLLQGLLSLTDSEYGFIGEVFYEDERPYLKTHAITNIAWDDATRAFFEANAARGLEFRNLETLFGSVMKRAEIVLANSPATDPRRGGLPPGHPALDAFLGIPIFGRTRLIGMVGIANRPGGYDNGIAEFLTPFLSTCASLITSVRVDRERAALVNDRERFLDRAVVPMCIASFQGELLWYNAAWPSLLGMSPDTLGAQTILDLTHPDDRASAAAALSRLHLGQVLEGFRSRVVCADGSARWLEWSASPDVEAQRIFATAIDITGQVRAQERLADSALRMATVLDTVVDGIITASDRGIIQTFNRAAENIFGYSADEVIGKNLNTLMADPHHTAHDGYLAAYRKTGKRRVIGIGREVEGRRKDGSLFPMDLAVGEMFIDGVRLYTGIVRDITERHTIRRMKDEFVSTVSHELRTPLTAISGSLRLLAGGVPVPIPAPALELVRIANNNCERLIRLISDMLDIDKIHAGQFDLRQSFLLVGELIHEAVAGIASLAQSAQIQLVATCDEELAVVGDRDRLLQVLTNLMSNAIKFSPTGSAVTVLAQASSSAGVRVEVIDRGRGIAPADTKRLFQKFQQLDSSDSRAQGGTGLGLAISKSLIELHGGDIGVDSVVGQGSTFWFELPSAAQGAP